MGTRIEPDCRFVHTGREPEYYVEGIGLQEMLDGGNVRTYVCSQRSGLLVCQYTSVVSIVKLSLMARRSLHTCAQFHNETTWRGDLTLN